MKLSDRLFYAVTRGHISVQDRNEMIALERENQLFRKALDEIASGCFSGSFEAEMIAKAALEEFK